MVDRGVSLNTSLIHSRYVTLDAPLVAPDGILDVAKTARGNPKNIELVGELHIRKRQQGHQLKDLSLRNMGIVQLTTQPMELQQLIQSDFISSVQDLDLAGNLISSWKEVWNILKIFPHLKHVSFAYNQIMDPEEEDSSDMDPPTKDLLLPHMTRWNLNECGITSFQTILWIERKCPNIQELYLAQNPLADISTATSNNIQGTTNIKSETSLVLLTNEAEMKEEDDENMDASHRQASIHDPVLPMHLFPHLIKLDLTHCQLHSWTFQVRMLRRLPQLQVLILNENPIRQITIAHITKPSSTTTVIDTSPSLSFDGSVQDEFPSLQELHLAGTLLDSWTYLHPLNFFPRLTYLRLSSTPLTQAMGTGEARIQIIARLSNIQQVNASLVTTKERMEAERRYVRGVAHELLKIQGADDEMEIVEEKKKLLLGQHPLFESLFIKHKDSMMTSPSSLDGDGATTTNTNLSSSHYNTLQVTIRSMASSSITTEPIQKRLPASFPIGRLKTLCFKTFGLDVHLQRLHVRCEVCALCRNYLHSHVICLFV